MTSTTGRPTKVRRVATHFGMFFLVLVPLYRGFQWRNVIAATSSSTFERNERNSNAGELMGRVTEVTFDSSRAKVLGNNDTETEKDNDAFEPGNIARLDRIPCGKEKCFFPLKSNKQVGYLVSRTEDREDRRERFQTLQAGWKLAQDLKHEFHLEHFLMAPPETITVSRELEAHLNRNLWSEKKEKLAWRNHKRYPKGSKAFVQKVQIAPKRTILIGCSQSKVKPFEHNVKSFMKHVQYPENFARRARENLSQVRQLFKKEPCLIKDFQVMMDSKGNIYHLDFDRCFSPDDASIKYEISSDDKDTCLEVLDAMEKSLQKNLAAANHTS